MGRQKSLSLNLKGGKLIKLGNQKVWGGKSIFLSLNLEDQINQCEIEFRNGVKSIQDQ